MITTGEMPITTEQMVSNGYARNAVPAVQWAAQRSDFRVILSPNMDGLSVERVGGPNRHIFNDFYQPQSQRRNSRPCPETTNRVSRAKVTQASRSCPQASGRPSTRRALLAVVAPPMATAGRARRPIIKQGAGSTASAASKQGGVQNSAPHHFFDYGGVKGLENVQVSMSRSRRRRWG